MDPTAVLPRPSSVQQQSGLATDSQPFSPEGGGRWDGRPEVAGARCPSRVARLR